MRLFKRGPAGPDPDAIPSFWRWWAGARDRVTAAIAGETLSGLVDEISRNVHAIDPRLAWELGKGSTAAHALVVSPEGDPAVRALAITWLAAAPPADSTWEYHASRQRGDLDSALQIGDREVDLDDYRAIASWDEGRERVDVRLWHPALADAPEDVRERVDFLFLDNLLGEDDVERWIGAIDALEAPISGRTPAELRAEIDRRAGEATGEAWVLIERTDTRTKELELVMVNAAIKPIDHPFRSHHLVVTVDRGLEQLSRSDEQPELDAAEERLVEAVEREDAIHLGHVTERRRRVIHFMCADADRARATADAWAAAERRFGPRIDIRPDPAWSFRDELGL